MGIFRTITDRLDRQAILLNGMTTRLDVDIGSVGDETHGLQLERVARACMFCDHGDACRQWLDDPANASARGAPAFCPNRAVFASHRRQPAEARATHR